MYGGKLVLSPTTTTEESTVSFIAAPIHHISLRGARALSLVAVLVCAGALALVLATSAPSTTRGSITHPHQTRGSWVVIPRHSYGLIP